MRTTTSPADRASLARLLTTDPSPAEVEDGVGLQRAGAVAVISLARPEHRNPLSLAGWHRVRALVDELAADPAAEAVVVRGVGGEAFGAGADITEFPTARMSAEATLTYNEAIADALLAVKRVPCPVIAMIDGLALGGAMELGAACDVRIASRRSRFGIPVNRLGVILGTTELTVVGGVIGFPALMHLLLSGAIVSAERAERIGYVQVLAEDDAVVGETAELVATILASSRAMIRATKLGIEIARRPITSRDVDVLTRLTVETYGGPELKEGVAAFGQKRAPRFAEVR